ncbi:Uncharacterised protein [Pseudomonas fluorescens]|jgi:hypothetical protein|uniref:Uncharacterized protein n=1 Tax=Pseudomonas fluorescens TaxID=294 RepID=A0A379IG18_PSEFL|nr:Uncharacterised protein [Pseudomonas fluorescens]
MVVKVGSETLILFTEVSLFMRLFVVQDGYSKRRQVAYVFFSEY